MKEIVPILIKNEATTRIHFPNENFFLIIFIILIKYMELEKLLYLLREAVVDCLGAKVLWIMGSKFQQDVAS